MRVEHIFFLLMFLVLVGCKNEKPDSNIISDGNQSSKEARMAYQNIDKNSYIEILPYLQDNAVIQSDGKRGILLIFGSNSCKYCDKLKEEIATNRVLQELVQNNFFSYYINLNYQKKHLFYKQEIDTRTLGEKYTIRPTPTLVFLNPKGEMIFKIIGFMGGERLCLALEFVSKNLDLHEEQIAQKLYNLFAQKSLL